MGLRSQLFWVALTTALLPWAGCHYVREMEEALRQNQASALLAQSQLMTRLVNTVQLPDAPAKDQPVFYSPRRYQPVQLDGYHDDWQSHAVRELPKIRLQNALLDEHLYLYLRVKNRQIHYHNPGFAFTHSDHIRISSGPPGQTRQWVFFTSAPGSLQGYEWHPEDKLLRPAPGLFAWWQETASGFDLEVMLPQNALQDRLDLTYYEVPELEETPDQDIQDTDDYDTAPEDRLDAARSSRARPVSSTRGPGQPASLWLTPLPTLTPLLASHRTEQQDATLINPQGWPLSEQRDVLNAELETTDNAPGNLFNQAVARFYRLLIDTLTPRESQTPWPLPTIELGPIQSAIDPQVISPANYTRARAEWYQLPRNRQSRLLTSQAVWQNGKLKGYLLLSQTSDALISLTNDALRRVTHLSLLVLALVIGVLVLFATSLSWRIRHLKQEAEKAISSDGRVSRFHASRRRDEIGDLSRSYQSLLHRIQGYTDYLETLNGKLAHELRTPLAIVKSSLEMLTQEDGSDSTGYLSRAQQGVERLRRILSAMSEASRVEQTIQQSEQHGFDLQAFLQELTSAYSDTYTEHRFRLQVAPALKLPADIHGSPELLAQLIDKLIDNARSFAPPGSEIGIQLDDRQDEYRLRIINRGPLLPTELEGRLFDSLVSRRDKSGGEQQPPHLGLGLYIVRLISSAHGGQVQADNLPDGSGVCFSLFLPKSQ